MLKVVGDYTGTREDILKSLLDVSECISVVPLLYQGSQIGLRYYFNNGIIVDLQKSNKNNHRGLNVYYSKKLNGYVTIEERVNKAYYLDVSNLEGIEEYLESR